jgi:hypothetical protein
VTPRLVAWARAVAVALGLAAVVIGCGPASGETGEPSAAATSPVDGVVIHVESTGLNRVSAFDLRTGDGRILTFDLSRLENGVEFPPGHLTEHQANSTPVRVYFEVLDGVAYAARLEDAPAPGGSSPPAS